MTSRAHFTMTLKFTQAGVHTLEITDLVKNLIDTSDKPDSENKKSLQQQPITTRVKSMSKEKLHRRILSATGRAIADFSMIEEGDRILVAISGGKDSWVMLKMLRELKRKAPVSFDIIAINIDQGYANFRQDLIEDYVTDNEIEFEMEEFDIASILTEKIDKGEVPCSLCSRLRRGSLYGLAEKHKCNKIALGHHLDDFIETLLLNSFFIGRLAAMAPKLTSDDGKNIVIRPLVYVSEAEIISYTEKSDFPIVCCNCPLMCGNASNSDSKRRMIKQLIGVLEEKIPSIRYSLLKSLSNVRPSHLLDRSMWDFS